MSLDGEKNDPDSKKKKEKKRFNGLKCGNVHQRPKKLVIKQPHKFLHTAQRPDRVTMFNLSHPFFFPFIEPENTAIMSTPISPALAKFHSKHQHGITTHIF